MTRREWCCAAFGVSVAASQAADGPDHDLAFRNGRFQAALELAEQALQRNPEDILAALTKVRVYDANYHTDLAEAEYAACLARGHDQSLVLSILPDLSFAEKHPDLLGRYLDVSMGHSVAHDRVTGLRRCLDRSNGERLCSISASPTAATCPIRRLASNPSHPGSMGLMVRVNGHKPATLALNSGAFGLWLTPDKARSLDVSDLGEGSISEPGMYGRQPGAFGFAQQIEVGGMSVRNVPVFLSDSGPFTLRDGMIGTATFRDVLVRVSGRQSTIAFESLPPLPPHRPGERSVPPELGNAVKCIRSRHVLLVPASIKNKSAFMLVQLQAEVNIIHTQSPMGAVAGVADPARFWSTGYSCPGEEYSVESVDLTIGSAHGALMMRNCNLAETWTKVGFPVAGVLGLAFLQDRSFALDQVHGLIAF